MSTPIKVPDQHIKASVKAFTPSLHVQEGVELHVQEGELASMEGTTQGDSQAMPWYSINTELLIFTLRRFISD